MSECMSMAIKSGGCLSDTFGANGATNGIP